MKKNYIETGKVRFYSVDLPLRIHPNASRAAQAAQCAAEQNQFWAMHDSMQGAPGRLEMPDLVDYARKFGMNVEAFSSCLGSGKYEDAIREAANRAMLKGIHGTPAMILGKGGAPTVEGELTLGVIPYETLDQKLKALLSAVDSQVSVESAH